MPIYQYHCPSCDNKFEAKQSFNDTSNVSCPRCKNGARRVFSPVPIIFKGSGFYVTDSTKKSEAQFSPKTEAKQEMKQEDKSETTATTTTTSKEDKGS
jgi:putative FmdB family regulatory protein